MFHNICRICMTNCESGTVPLIENNDVNKFGKAVLTFANISITNNDSLPTTMCFKCGFLLRNAIHFKLTCESTHKKLTEMHRNNEGILNNSNCSEEKTSIRENIAANAHYIEESDEKKIKDMLLNDFNDIFTNSDADDNNIDEDDKEPSTHNKIDDIIKENLDLLLSDNDYDSMEVDNIDNTEQADDDDDPDLLLDALDKMVEEREQKTKNAKCGTQDKSYKCNVCEKVLANSATFANHMQRHNGYKYMCEHCGKMFASRGDVRFHVVCSHGRGDYLQCNICGYKAAKRYQLVEHSRVHSGERPFRCEVCHVTFRRRAIYVQHRRLHQERTVQCPQCPRRFPSRSRLSSHAMSHVASHRCVACRCDFARRAALNRHLARRHATTAGLAKDYTQEETYVE